MIPHLVYSGIWAGVPFALGQCDGAAFSFHDDVVVDGTGFSVLNKKLRSLPSVVRGPGVDACVGGGRCAEPGPPPGTMAAAGRRPEGRRGLRLILWWRGVAMELQESAVSGDRRGDRLRILHVLDTIDGKSGGPVQWMKVSAEAQLARADPEVVTLDKADAPFIRDFPFKVHAFGEDHKVNTWAPAFGYSSSLLPWLKAHAGDYDAVVVHGIWSYHALAVWKALAGTRTPYVVYPHGMMDPWFKRTYPLKHLKKQAYWSLFLGKILRDAQAVLFTAEDEQTSARGVFAGFGTYKERLVKLGIAPPPSRAEEQSAAFRALLPQLEGRPFLLHLGRIDPKKGCDLLVAAFAQVAQAHPDLRLVMAGPDQAGWRPKLEAMAVELGVADRVLWPGMVTGDAKWGAFRLAQAFVLPSHQENFGIAVAEALACGTPVIISNKVNIWREIEAGGAGLVAEDDLAGTVTNLQAFQRLDAKARDAMRTRAFEVFHERFNLDRCAMELVDLLEHEVIPNMPGSSSAGA